MKSENFTKGMQFVFFWEGGAVDDPADPGGRTNYGVTQRTYNKYCDVKGLPHKDVFLINKVEALDVYEWGYWSDKWDELGFELAVCMLDTSINMGMGKAQSFLRDCEGNYVIYLQLRNARYKELIQKNPSLGKFAKGWANRMTDLRRFIDENRGIPV